MLRAYLATGPEPDETFQAFAAATTSTTLQRTSLRSSPHDARQSPTTMLAAAAAPGKCARSRPAQRAWLNGFFAGLLDARQRGATPWRRPHGASATAAAAPAGAGRRRGALARPALALAERMKLAEGRPLPRRLMAAMAQLDCGQCGYVCETYAEAIAERQRESSTCARPAASDTAQDAEGAAGRETPAARRRRPARRGRTAAAGADRRPRPVDAAPAQLHVAAPLNAPGIGEGHAARRARPRRHAASPTGPATASASSRERPRRWSRPIIAALGAPPDDRSSAPARPAPRPRRALADALRHAPSPSRRSSRSAGRGRDATRPRPRRCASCATATPAPPTARRARPARAFPSARPSRQAVRRGAGRAAAAALLDRVLARAPIPARCI